AIAGTSVGAAVGGGAGAAAAGNATVNNYLKHTDIDALSKQLQKCDQNQDCRKQAIDGAYAVSAVNDKELLNCKATGNCDELKSEYRQGYAAAVNMLDKGVPPEEVGRILNMDSNAQAIIRGGLDQRQCVGQACKDNAAFLVGLGKGLMVLTPGGAVLATGIGSYEVTTAIINNGAGETAISIAKNIAGLPSNIVEGLNSPDPQVRGEALGMALATGSTAAVVGTRLAEQGITAVSNIGRRAEAGRAEAGRAEAAASAKARIDSNARTDDASQYDAYRRDNSSRPGGEWDWQKQAPNNGAVPGSTQSVTIEPGKTLDRYGSRNGEYMSPAGASFEERALPPGKQADPYEKYTVAKPFTATQEVIAPAFGQPGGGVQIRAKIPEKPEGYANINELVRFGYLK
ncbi:TNT domain-containing protein, partial [Xylophilus ampelinus]